MAKGRILYVEDNFDNRILIKRVLEAEDYTVIEAENGQEGMSLARTSDPDLILMDINLPDVDGYECTRRLRAEDTTRDIPILALTANVLEGDKQKAFRAGCNGYISKPIDVDELPRKIAAHINGTGKADSRAKRPADESPPQEASPPKKLGMQRDGWLESARRQTGPLDRTKLRGSTLKDDTAAEGSSTTETPAAPSRNIGASSHDRTAP